MKPIFSSHATYQDFVMTRLQEHYGSSGILVLVNKDWPTIKKLWITDLSLITNFLSNEYGVKGPLPRDPSSMMRSYLLLILTNPTMSITKWVDELRRVPLYAILSGFEPGNTLVSERFMTSLNVYGVQKVKTGPINGKVKIQEHESRKRERTVKRHQPLHLVE